MESTLALAPVNVRVTTHDLITTLEAIGEVRDEAEELLEDGKIQEARSLLAPLGSEIVVSVARERPPTAKPAKAGSTGSNDPSASSASPSSIDPRSPWLPS